MQYKVQKCKQELNEASYFGSQLKIEDLLEEYSLTLDNLE
jgi:hypothetical protein